jgi:hypothetical protein
MAKPYSEDQPVFWPVAGPVGTGRRPRFPGSPCFDGHFVAGAQSDCMRLAFLLRRHAWPGAHPGARFNGPVQGPFRFVIVPRQR